jgi:hypothetical protein
MKCVLNPTKKIESTTKKEVKPLNTLTITDKAVKKGVSIDKLKKPLSKSKNIIKNSSNVDNKTTHKCIKYINKKPIQK